MSQPELRAQNKMWVLTRFRLQMEQYPRNGDLVTVETWASSRTSGVRAVREFQFVDAGGKVLGRALSIWLMLDAVKKRPVRLPHEIHEICNAERSDPAEFEIPRLTPPEKISRTRGFEVGWIDLDANSHVNNGKYLEWALEALPLERNRDQRLAQIDIEFLAEAFYADQVISEVEICREVCVHELKNAAGTLLTLAVSRWVTTETP